MAGIIADQNRDIRTAWLKYNGLVVDNNHQLASRLGIQQAPAEYQQDYATADLGVKVI